MRWLSLVGHPRLLVRFLALYALGLVLFFGSWTAAYLLLPEGLVQGFGMVASLAGDTAADSLLQEFLRIFLLNAVFSSILVLGGNAILRVKGFAFGYLVPLAWMVHYGIILGTNSFAIPMEQVMAPSLAVFGRAGLYEMMASVLLAVSTYSIARNYSDSMLSPSKPVPKSQRGMNGEQWLGLRLAYFLFAVAAFREAYMIMQIG